MTTLYFYQTGDPKNPAFCWGVNKNILSHFLQNKNVKSDFHKKLIGRVLLDLTLGFITKAQGTDPEHLNYIVYLKL